MADIPPDFWVEVVYDENMDLAYPLMMVNTLFTVREWKYFLLERYKYRPRDDYMGLPDYSSFRFPSFEFSSESKYRGLPDDVSRTVRQEKENREWSRATYYTLRELGEIDLDEEMSVPKTTDQLSRGNRKHAVNFKIIDDDEEHDIGNETFSKNKQMEAIEKGSIEIEMYRRNSSYAFKPEYLIKNSEKESDEPTPEPEKVTVTLKAEIRKKREHATDFKEFIEFLNELRTNEELKGNIKYQDGEFGKFSKEDFRIVILYK